MNWALLALFGALAAYSLADAVGVIPGERGWRPWAMVCLTIGLLLQPSAALLGRRSRVLQFGLLVLSIVLVLASVRVRS